MKRASVVQIGLLVALMISQSCTKPEADSCAAPQQVTADAQCYAGSGLRLTAADYGSGPVSFEWSLYALKDSSAVLGWTPQDEKIRLIAGDTFVVPDSLLTPYRRIIVTVAANCGGLLKHSKTYGFVKTRGATSGCTQWTVQNQ
jgi:hypothetical protein